ncbi:hypothetical protein PPIS_b0139 [Pseudoalteromonas piscicida]|uniref:Uncharacterized protein n=1 Tax=Pseudoalteromonas piscicida TaxID=43662 RepID=A0ABM6NKE9_PSEO7|nr:hypothetical protein PPIS_b0139 [Pseudoalteromonas piscicida]
MQATVKRLDDVNTTPEKHNFSADKPPYMDSSNCTSHF